MIIKIIHHDYYDYHGHVHDGYHHHIIIFNEEEVIIWVVMMITISILIIIIFFIMVKVFIISSLEWLCKAFIIIRYLILCRYLQESI